MNLKIIPNEFPSSIPEGGRVQLAIIGEAPGRDEEIFGRPFVGAAGRELERWIQPHFVRSNCFVGNLSQQRPPDNKLENWFVNSKCTTPNERLQGWIDTLRMQLEKVRPNLIIALGRHPLFALTGKDGITKQWGSLLPCTLVPGLKVIAIPHPSFIIRGMFDLRPIIQVWLRRAKEHCQFPEYKIPQRELVIDPSLEVVMYHLDRLLEAKELASDIETVPGKRLRRQVRDRILTPDIISCISFSDSPDWSISIPFSRAGGQHRWAADVEKEIWRRISILYSSPALKIFHNLMFDFLELAGHGIYVQPPYYDTMKAHNCAYPDFTKKKLKKLQLNRLAFCTALYTEEPFYKDDHKDENKGDDWRGADIEFWKYNAKDSAVLHEIKASTKRDMETFGVYELFQKDMKVFEPLAYMGLEGVKRDAEKLQELVDFVCGNEKTKELGRITSLQNELNEAVGTPINTKSSQQLQNLLYVQLGFPVQYNKETGKPTADEGAIAKLYQKTKNPILLKIKELNRFRTFKQNYLDSVVGEDGRTRTTYNQSKTTTFRVSSSDAILGEGKNLQVIPSYPKPGEDDYNRLIVLFKKTFITDEGMMMWRRDYRQAEAMVVAWLSEDLQQINDFLDGVDMHCRTVEILYDMPYDTVLAKVKEGDPEIKIKRNLGKRIRHGANYKLGELELSRQFAMLGYDIPTKQCRLYLQAIASNVPSILRWHQEVEDTLRRTRTITNIWGRKRRFFGVVDNEMIREAIAQSPQSSIGDLLNFALERIYNEPGLMNEMDLLLQLHDAAIGQSPFDKLQAHTDIVEKLMEIPVIVKGRELVIPTDLDVGSSWGDLGKPEWK